MKKYILFLIATLVIASFQTIKSQVTAYNANNGNDDATSSLVRPYAWDGKGVYNGGYDANPSSLATSEADRRAACIMQRTGNWRFVEPYLPYLSEAGTVHVEIIFRSKGGNPPARKDGSQTSAKIFTPEEADTKGVTTMRLTGTWSKEIDFLVPQMTSAGLERMVSIYLERQLFPEITPPEGARRVMATIALALNHMTEDARKAVEEKISAYF